MNAPWDYIVTACGYRRLALQVQSMDVSVINNRTFVPFKPRNKAIYPAATLGLSYLRKARDLFSSVEFDYANWIVGLILFILSLEWFATSTPCAETHRGYKQKKGRVNVFRSRHSLPSLLLMLSFRPASPSPSLRSLGALRRGFPIVSPSSPKPMAGWGAKVGRWNPAAPTSVLAKPRPRLRGRQEGGALLPASPQLFRLRFQGSCVACSPRLTAGRHDGSWAGAYDGGSVDPGGSDQAPDAGEHDYLKL